MSPATAPCASSRSRPASATPERTYTLLNRESPEFVRFVNPGDLRAAREACGACHLAIVQASERSLMATSAMLPFHYSPGIFIKMEY